ARMVLWDGGLVRAAWLPVLACRGCLGSNRGDGGDPGRLAVLDVAPGERRRTAAHRLGDAVSGRRGCRLSAAFTSRRDGRLALRLCVRGRVRLDVVRVSE